jgi:16S rRNA G966 N2-methylase RsmD
MDCCGGYDEVFTERQARWQRCRYERQGLTGPGRAIVDWLTARGLRDGLTVLEIGGGVGELQVELLRYGAARATNVELARSWEAEARRLLVRHGLEGRVERVFGDLVTQPEVAGEADVVVLNRVVCCYPDYAGLLRAAGERARRALVFTHPPRNTLVCAGLCAVNAWEHWRRREYRAFAHPPEAMVKVLGQEGLRPVASRRVGVWWLRGLERAA